MKNEDYGYCTMPNWYHRRTGVLVADREAFEEWLKGIENA